MSKDTYRKVRLDCLKESIRNVGLLMLGTLGVFIGVGAIIFVCFQLLAAILSGEFLVAAAIVIALFVAMVALDFTVSWINIRGYYE